MNKIKHLPVTEEVHKDIMIFKAQFQVKNVSEVIKRLKKAFEELEEIK